MLIDTHTHFYDEWLLPDAEAAVQRALDAGVGKMLQADVDSRERPAMWEIGDRHPGVIFEMLGLYPGSVAENWRDELDQVHSIAALGYFDSYTMRPMPDQLQETKANQLLGTKVDQVQQVCHRTAWEPQSVDQVQGIKLDLVQQQQQRGHAAVDQVQKQHQQHQQQQAQI